MTMPHPVRFQPLRRGRWAACGVLLLAGCAATSAPDSVDPQTRFWAALESHCGKAYTGRLVTADAADADLAGRAMVMAVTECSDTRIAVPFHVENADGTWDRSRTWLITRNDAGGLRLKHDHRRACNPSRWTPNPSRCLPAKASPHRSLMSGRSRLIRQGRRARPMPINCAGRLPGAPRRNGISGSSSISPSRLPCRRQRGAGSNLRGSSGGQAQPQTLHSNPGLPFKYRRCGRQIN